jgi:hypothetical protein
MIDSSRVQCQPLMKERKLIDIQADISQAQTLYHRIESHMHMHGHG